jgi:hypothetical protein
MNHVQIFNPLTSVQANKDSTGEPLYRGFRDDTRGSQVSQERNICPEALSSDGSGRTEVGEGT